MKNEQYEQIKKELQQLKEQNNEQIAISDERTRMAKVNNLEDKCLTTLFFSLLTYTALFLTSFGIVTSLGTSVITNIFPGFTYHIALIGSSIGIGTIGKKLFDKKFQTKERLESFSTAKTQEEKLEEEVHYEIELEKATNRNKAIDEAINVLTLNQTILSKISNRYDLNDRNVPQSKEEGEEKIEELSNTIKTQYDKLDILTTQKVLHERFWSVRQKYRRRGEVMLTSMLSGMFTMLFSSFPTLMIIKDITISNSLLAALAVPFVPLVVGSIAGGTYMLKRNRDYQKVFKNLNVQLGENALADNLDKKFESAYEEQKEIDTLIESQIRDISSAILQLKEQQQFLKELSIKDSEEQDRTNSILNTLKRKDVENIIDNPTLFLDEVYGPAFDALITDEKEKQEKGPTLVKKKK